MFRYILSRLLKKIRFSAIKNTHIHKTSKIESGSQVIDSSIGKYSFCGYDCTINSTQIGSFTSISNRVIIGGENHPYNWVSTSPVFYYGRDSIKKKFAEHKRDVIKTTIIGNDVWIGENVIIKQGVNIGDGAVIGMGSVVTKNVEPYSIVAGNPARFIKYRFNEEIIRKLISLKFWNLDEKQLSKFSQYITDPELFIKKFSK